MTKRYDVIYPRNYELRDGSKGTDWHRIGVAFEGDKQFTVTLYALPVGGIEKPGEVRLILKPSEGRERGREARQGPEVERRPMRAAAPRQGALEPQVEGWHPPEDTDNIPF